MSATAASQRWTGRLLRVAVLAAGLACGLTLLWREALHLPPGSAALTAHLPGAFAAWPWSALLRLTAVASAAALLLTLLERAKAPRRGPALPPLGQSLDMDRSLAERLGVVEQRVLLCVNAPEPDHVAALDELLRGAIALSASDLHLSPKPTGVLVTYRVAGSLFEVATLPSSSAAPLATRIKVVSHLTTYVHAKPQDGRLRALVDGRTIDARVSTLPTESGERIVVRFVRGTLGVPSLDTLGLSRRVLEHLEALLARPEGLLFISGPVGSGKSTTLYAALHHLAQSRAGTTALVTLEDPIELVLPFATQTQVNPRTGMTFAGTLRSVLRQDPNVLMIGEIRDSETAAIAAQAGLTGHLVLTSVHAMGAAGPFARMVEMGVEPFVVASASLGGLSQRLVRLLCPECRKETAPEQAVVDRFAERGIQIPEARYFEPVGCAECEGIGFSGRAPIAELLVVDEPIRRAIGQSASTQRLQELALAAGTIPLLRDGLERAQRGETSLREVLGVAG